MRWFWIDRFTEFVSGTRCTGIKNVTLVEEVIDNYSPSHPVMPCSVMIEGLAQCGGILVAESLNYEKRVVLAKISSAVFHQPAEPGDQLYYHVTLGSVMNDGAVVHCTIECRGKEIAKVELMFAFLDDAKFGTKVLFAPADLRGMLHLMKLYEVAVDTNGNRLAVSPNLLEDNHAMRDERKHVSITDLHSSRGAS